MIVRNEGPRMSRLLDTVKNLVDEVVISDTGSTDDTIAVTREKCKELGLPFYLDETPFKDFGFNRSRSITVAVEKSKCDYLLFLDADMKLVLTSKFDKQTLLGTGIDVMSMMQKGCGLEYYNMRIMRRTLPGLKCIGVTHEHYSSEGHTTTTNLPAEMIYIDDIGDGGSKSDKFPRDYRLLKKGLEDEPANVRYMFYLAETCRHDMKLEESIKYYKMRVKAGGWDEEIYRSLYGITLCYMGLGKQDKADAYAVRAHIFRPSRTESLYAVCKWHRERGENNKAYAFYQLGSRVARPKDDVLFVETAPYIWAWDYEFAILAYYIERKAGPLKNPIGTAACLRRILSSLGPASARGPVIPDYAFDNMVDNVKHYTELLPTSFPRTDMMPLLLPGFTSSTPGIVRLAGQTELLRFARHVDYKIRKESGCYILRPDGCVGSTYTIQTTPEAPWRVLRVDCTGVEEGPPGLIKNVEDVKLFNLAPSTGILRSTMSDDSITTRINPEQTDTERSRVYGIGTTVQYSKDGRSTMVILEVDVARAVAFPIKRIPRIFDCEKNHAPISGTNLCVHAWGPRLKIYDIVKTTEDKIEWVYDFAESEVPGWFRNLRGSSCGVAWPSTGPAREYWFMCHTVAHESPRRYMHSIVRLDAQTFRPVGFTVPFSFDDFKIEFVGGIAFDDNDRTLVAGYSVFDSSSREVRIPVPWLIQTMMVTVASVPAP